MTRTQWIAIIAVIIILLILGAIAVAIYMRNRRVDAVAAVALAEPVAPIVPNEVFIGKRSRAVSRKPAAAPSYRTVLGKRQ